MNNHNAGTGTEKKTKRKYGRGYIKEYEDRKGVFRIAVSLGKDPKSSTYRYQWHTVKGTRKDAERKLTQLLHEVDKGEVIQPGKMRLKDFLVKYVEDYVRPNLSPKTAEGYEFIFNHHIIPALGALTLNALKAENLRRLYKEKLDSDLSATTVRHHHTCLHRALVKAVEWELLTRNPADAVTPPKLHRTEMKTWDEDDIEVFLKAARETPYYTLFHLALWTGMRRSELLALKWSDVDLSHKQVHVSRSLHVLKGGEVNIRQPKSAKGKRLISLPDLAVSVLREHKGKQMLEREEIESSLKDDDYVFSNIDGKPLLPNTVTHAWIKLVKSTGLKRIRLHDARHTHASLMLKLNIHPKVVQERLGHSSISITLDTYSHVVPGLQEAAAERFDQAFTERYNNDHGKRVV